MKVKEIKVDDWVSFADVPVKVKEVKQDGVCVDLSCFDNSKGEQGYVEFGDLSPILLTSEILKKNGWEEKKKEFSEGVIYTNGWYVSSKSEEGGFWMLSHYDDFLTTIKYVHQLQHLLWALGIDDDLKI